MLSQPTPDPSGPRPLNCMAGGFISCAGDQGNTRPSSTDSFVRSLHKGQPESTAPAERGNGKAGRWGREWFVKALPNPPAPTTAAVTGITRSPFPAPSPERAG